MPLFTFGLSPSEPAIEPDSGLWTTPLPASRHAFGRRFRDRDFDARVTYGDYFSAARDFLAQNDSALLCSAVGQLLNRPVCAADVERVAVYLVKHGAFYHPSYIKVLACGRWWSFVLNVAVSAAGQKVLEQEFQNLARLNRELSASFWPLVFGFGCGRMDTDARLPMFLGQWLEGFYEFHLTAGPGQDHAKVVLWDVDQGPRILTNLQVRELLRQAAFILAYTYNPLTFEAILNWHHAAGDFVVHSDEGGLSVRLITVRKYAPLVALAEPDVGALLEVLLVYLVDISLRLRVDRLDGTNQMVCHPTEMIPAICNGFLQGLHAGASQRGLPDDFAQTVRQFFALHDSPDLTPIAHSVIMKYPADADEHPLLQSAVETHVSALAKTLAIL